MEDTTTAANAARDGARAARDSADVSKIAMVAGERAYVHHAGCRAISHLNPANATVFWRIRPLWTNAGNTPARKAEIYAHYELRDSPLPPEYAFTRQELPLTETMIAAGAVIESGPRDISGQELLDIAAGRKFFYIWGIARYRDVFPETPERVTKFCVQALTITGNPMVGWDANNNPLEIVFIGFHRHYCMDEDC